MGVALIELVLVGVAAPVTSVLVVGFWVLVGLVRVFGLRLLVASVLEVEVVIGL